MGKEEDRRLNSFVPSVRILCIRGDANARKTWRITVSPTIYPISYSNAMQRIFFLWIRKNALSRKTCHSAGLFTPKKYFKRNEVRKDLGKGCKAHRNGMTEWCDIMQKWLCLGSSMGSLIIFRDLRSMGNMQNVVMNYPCRVFPLPLNYKEKKDRRYGELEEGRFGRYFAVVITGRCRP